MHQSIETVVISALRACGSVEIFITSMGVSPLISNPFRGRPTDKTSKMLFGPAESGVRHLGTVLIIGLKGFAHWFMKQNSPLRRAL